MNTDSDIAQQRPDCVVIDTNIWRSELLLRTPKGVSLVYTLGRQGGYIGLPEVIEREVTNQVLEHACDANRKVEDGSRIISTLTDTPFLPFSASEVALEQAIRTRLGELERILVRVPFTVAHANAALDMVNARVPPNGKGNQQFKDSAIWQAVLDLSLKYTVHLITNDTGFFLDRKTTKGLATNLQEDCKKANGSVAIYHDFATCLDALTSDKPPFDREGLISLIEPFVMPRLQAEATRLRYELKESPRVEVTAFRTGDSSRIAVDFTFLMRGELEPSVRRGSERVCRAAAYGSCYYDPTSDAISDEFLQEIHFLSRSFRHLREFKHEDSSIPFPRPLQPDA